jgi:hypothetical protein
MGVDAETVFDVLSDPDSYGEWVVGSRYIRDADPDWPAVGSRFHHTVGLAGPLSVSDHTCVEGVERPTFLQLRARARPIGTALVTLELERSDGGTHVTMVEDPADTFSALVFNPLVHLLTRRRNEESLRRLERLAQARQELAGAAAGTA